MTRVMRVGEVHEFRRPAQLYCVDCGQAERHAVHGWRWDPDAGDHGARFDLAMALFGAGEREDAVSALLEIVRRDRAWNDDAARKQLLTFFEALGPKDPLVANGRRRLSAQLFS